MGFFKHQIFGIDMGTDTIKIYDYLADRTETERNLVIMKNGNELVAVGNEAYDLVNRESNEMKVISPITGGRISDVLMMEAILHILLVRQKHYVGRDPSIYFGVPTEMTEIEKRTYASVTQRGRLRHSNVYLVEKPIADAIAMGVSTRRTMGTMIVNFGACNTDISVIAASRVILSKSIPIGGNNVDAEIAASIRRNNRLFISTKQAETIKLNLAGNTDFLIGGIDSANGLPRKERIEAADIQKTAAETLAPVLEEINNFYKRTPPQIAESIQYEGIFITGGVSHTEGLAERLKEITGVPINPSNYFQFSTVNGLRRLIQKKASLSK